MMKKRGKKDGLGARKGTGLLSHDEGSVYTSHCLGFLDTSSDATTEDMIWDYFAQIIGDIYLEEKYGYKPQKKGGNIL